MLSKQPDSMPTTDADVSDVPVSDAVVISEDVDAEAGVDAGAVQSALPATASDLIRLRLSQNRS